MHLLNESVLILNKHYLAIQVCAARDAIIALVTGKAMVVDQDYKTYNMQEWGEKSKDLANGNPDGKLYAGVLRSPSISLMVPQVIVAHDCEYNNPGIRQVRYSRKNVYQRDRYTCQYCGEKLPKKDLTLDHVTPKSRGGTSGWNNVVTSCLRCNSKKRDYLLSELGWTLKNPPKQPKWKSHIGIPFNSSKKDYWDRFLK